MITIVGMRDYQLYVSRRDIIVSKLGDQAFPFLTVDEYSHEKSCNGARTYVSSVQCPSIQLPGITLVTCVTTSFLLSLQAERGEMRKRNNSICWKGPVLRGLV